MKSGLNRLVKQLKTDDWIGKMIDAYQDKAEPERWVSPNPDIHPSSSGSSCARDIELGMLGHRTQVKAQNRRRMENGTKGHERWEQYFRDIGILFAAEVKVIATDPFFNGTCDVIIENPLTGKRIIGELKTMNSKRWERIPIQVPDKKIMMRHLAAIEKPYVYQLTMYVQMMKEQYNTEDECFFLFENTDTQEFKVRYCEPDEELKKECFSNPLEAQKAFLEKRLIDPPYSKGSAICQHCYRRGVCFRIQENDPTTVEKLNEVLGSL